jgi:hypothetical protein
MGGTCGSRGREMKRTGGFGKEIRGYEFTQRSPNRRRVDSTQMGLKQLGCLELDGSHFSADKKKWWAVVKWVMKVRVLSTTGNFLKS